MTSFISAQVKIKLNAIALEFTRVLCLDNGKVLKAVNIPNGNSSKAVVISENTVMPNGAPVKQIKLSPVSGKIIAVSRDEVRLVDLNHCSSAQHCS